MIDFRLNGEKQKGVLKVEFDVKEGCFVVYYKNGDVMKIPLGSK